MTKKDHAIIAKVFNDTHERYKSTVHHEARRAVETTARYMATVLAEDNSSFDRVKFLTACGVM